MTDGDYVLIEHAATAAVRDIPMSQAVVADVSLTPAPAPPSPPSPPPG